MISVSISTTSNIRDGRLSDGRSVMGNVFLSGDVPVNI